MSGNAVAASHMIMMDELLPESMTCLRAVLQWEIITRCKKVMTSTISFQVVGDTCIAILTIPCFDVFYFILT